nr:hypothetical protein [uncultured Lichenicoccus sp.]
MPRMILPRLAIPAAAVMLAILGLHAALLPEAQWQGDDFICAAFAREYRLAYLWNARIAGWSPRPLSETVFYLYGRLAASLQRPLTVPFLALLWTLLFASTLAGMRRWHWPRVLIGLAACCLFLLGHPVGQMFYWPAGAVAYVSTLAMSSLAVFLLIDGRFDTWPGTVAVSGALAACAACSEAGACLATLLAPSLAALRWRRAGMALILGLPGLGVAGFVFWEVAHHRMASSEAAGHLTLLQSLRAALPDLCREAGAFWPAKLAFLLGVRWCAAGQRPDARALLACAIALPLAACITAAAAWHQFGQGCCERHESLRQCWGVLMLSALGVASVRARPVGTRAAGFGPAALLLACLIGTAPRVPPILHDMRMMTATIATHSLDWRRGRALSDTMLFQLPQPAAVAGTMDFPAGRFIEPAPYSWKAHGMMLFFHKRCLTILAPDAPSDGAGPTE